MKLKKLTLSSFRNIDYAQIISADNVNVISGENAQGKTNLIEAIWMLSGAKSFRGAKDSELIKKEKEKATIEAEFISNKIEKQAKIEIKDKRTAFLNDKKLSSPTLLASHFSAIIFSPADVLLVGGAPSIRRKFLDTAICQLYPNYIELLHRYTKAVEQRNSILKDSFRDASKRIFLEDFEEEMIKSGEKINEYRRKYIELLLKYSPQIYSDLSSGREIFDIEYICSSKNDLRKEIEKSRKEDMYRGATSVGPHRDDIFFKINSFTAKEYSSQGQKRSISLACKLSSAEIIKEITKSRPIALLDDVMSELDKGRQNYILNHIKGWQVFITCCDEAQIQKLSNGKIFKAEKGRIT